MSSAPTRVGKASSAHVAPAPHARMVIPPWVAPTRISVVAGPLGVRVARQTPSPPMRIVGSVTPRRRGPQRPAQVETG